MAGPQRSIIIPVLDLEGGGPYNIFTLLEELEAVPGEVICIFNSPEVHEALASHPRIDKWCLNSANPGVARSWNIGINLAESDVGLFMNSDLSIRPGVVEELEHYLFTLPDALIVGPQGSHIDFKNLRVVRYFAKGTFHQPVVTHDVSGFFFCMNLALAREKGLMFDVRYSPCFFEEWDMGLQAIRAGLRCYAVPVVGFEHEWGISNAPQGTIIPYFGRKLTKAEVAQASRRRFVEKWAELLKRL